MEKSYYLDNDEMINDCASSIPYQFVVKKENDNYVVVDSRTPRDGSLYNMDMKAIFPSSVRKDMENIYVDGTIERLQLDIEQQLKLYYHI